MLGNKFAKKVFRYCDCSHYPTDGCYHCIHHQKGFIKRYWRKWNKRRLDVLWHTDNES